MELGRYLVSASDDPAIYGTFTGSVASGFRFLSRVASHGNSRRRHRSIQAALPRWVQAGYYVRAASAEAAVTLTKAFRQGQHWADEEYTAGNIILMRNGKMEIRGPASQAGGGSQPGHAEVTP